MRTEYEVQIYGLETTTFTSKAKAIESARKTLERTQAPRAIVRIKTLDGAGPWVYSCKNVAGRLFGSHYWIG